MQRDKQHALTTPSTTRVAIPIEIVHLHLPQPASTTALTTPSSFRVAFPTTISSLHAVHPANTIHAATISTTAIDHSFSNQQTMRDTQLPYTVSVVFPIQFARLDPPISVHVEFPITTMFNFRHCH